MPASNFSDYTVSNGITTNDSGSSDDGKTQYWSHERLKRSYLDYLNSKQDEVNEQKEARRYRHASQWTDKQIKEFNKRRQPIVTYNRIGRKIDGVIGLVEKLRQSPKAYPRTPTEEGSADLATAVVRAVLDTADWKAKSYIAAQNAAVDGFGGMELMLETGDQGDPDVGLEVVENDGFFYDPRSIRLDFSDCRFMGQGKWLDMDQAKEMFPDQADDIEDGMDSASDLSTNSDREQRWFISNGNIKRVRIVDEWYIMNGEWCWCIYTGNMKLDEGKSYFHDEKGKTFCKYLVFSASVDQDGDRYGFVRNLKSAQDEINQRRSKALHLLNTRRIFAEVGAFDDIEATRREATRPDGVVLRNKGFDAEFDDNKTNQEIQAHLEFLVDAKSEIENFGPNPALIGQGSVGDKSGRAISLLQQAGIAELGPFLLAYRAWKIRIYRAVWNAVKEHWRAQRYIRVTDDMNAPQMVGINQVGVNPQTGMPQMVNHIANLDVDIIIDEGPDSITTMADTYDALLALVQNGQQVPPQVLLELAPGIDGETKKRILDQLNAPNPMQQIQQQAAVTQIQQVAADAKLKEAQAVKALSDARRQDSGADIQAEMVKNEQNLRFKQQEHEMDMVHAEQKHRLELHKSIQDSQVKLAETKAQSDAKLNEQRQSHQMEMAKAHDEHSRNMEAKASEPKQAAATPNITVNIDGFKDVAKAMTAPKRLVKGKDGSKTVETVT